MNSIKLDIKSLAYVGIALVVGNSLLKGRGGVNSTNVRAVSTSSVMSDLKYLIVGVLLGVVFNKQINTGISKIITNATKIAGYNDAQRSFFANQDAQYSGLNRFAVASSSRQQSILAPNRTRG